MKQLKNHNASLKWKSATAEAGNVGPGGRPYMERNVVTMIFRPSVIRGEQIGGQDPRTSGVERAKHKEL
jgi:hypothetical protein